jgi:hypothetical protein
VLNVVPVNIVLLLQRYYFHAKVPHNVLLTCYYVIHKKFNNMAKEEGYSPKQMFNFDWSFIHINSLKLYTLISRVCGRKY